MLKTIQNYQIYQNYQNVAELIQNPADGQAWMKDYGLGPLVESKAWFNQNVQQTKKKVVMIVQLNTLSSILLFSSAQGLV